MVGFPSRNAFFWGVVPWGIDLKCVSRDDEHICRTPHGRFTSFICVHLLIALPPPEKFPSSPCWQFQKVAKKQKTEEPAMSNPRIDKRVGILELFDDPILLSWTTVLGVCLEHPRFRERGDFSWLFHGNQTWLARKFPVRWCYPAAPIARHWARHEPTILKVAGCIKGRQTQRRLRAVDAC